MSRDDVADLMIIALRLAAESGLSVMQMTRRWEIARAQGRDLTREEILEGAQARDEAIERAKNPPR